MRPRIEAVCLLTGSATADLATRLAQVALPLVVLAETGSVAATGLVAGASGIPVLVSPWWARRARHWIDSGPRLAMIAIVEAVALALVPAAAALGLLDPVVLAISGLLLGTGEALSGPGRAALIADVGDRTGPDRAVALLTIQDGLRRFTMVVGPPVAAIAIGVGLTLDLLWMQAAVVLTTGLLAVPVRAAEPTGEASVPPPRVREVVASRPEVRWGWVLRGTGCVTWFAFSLGLSVLGVRHGRPGVYLAAGMSGYGVGAVAGTAIAVRLVRRHRPLVLACFAWTTVGLCWLALGLYAVPVTVTVVASMAGLAVAVGIAAISATITRSSVGAERRTLLAGQTVVVNAGSAGGMLLGGPLIAAIGPEPTLVATGIATAIVGFAVGAAVFGGRLRLDCEAERGAATGAGAARRRDRGVGLVRPGPRAAADLDRRCGHARPS